MPAPQIENFYDKLEKKYREEEQHYEGEKEIRIKVPFRMLVIGATGSGKTNAVENIVTHINAWDKILLFAKNVEEPLWAQFIDRMRKVEKDAHTDILTVDTDISHLPSVDKWDKKNSMLLILDDMMSESWKLIKQHVEPWWTRGRKKHASCIWLGQSYFQGVPLSLRQNSDYIILTKIRGNGDLHRILSEYPLDVTKDEIVRLFQQATKGGFPNFFMIDLNAKENGSVGVEYRYRRNYEPLEYNHMDGEKKGEKGVEPSSKPGSKKRKSRDDDEEEPGKKKETGKKKGRARGRVGVTVTPGPKKELYKNKPVLMRKELTTAPDVSWEAGYSKAENERRLNAFEVWFKGLTPAQQVKYQKTLLDQGATVHSAPVRWVTALLHDDDEAMDEARDDMEEEGEEELLGRHTEHMEEGDGLRRAKKRRRVQQRSTAKRPLARHTTEQQKALERLAGRRQHAYWS